MSTKTFRPLSLPIGLGISTRYGSNVYRVHGIDHDENTWWVELTLTDNPKIRRQYHPAYLICDDTKEAAQHFQTISNAILEMLSEDGEYVSKSGMPMWRSTV